MASALLHNHTFLESLNFFQFSTNPENRTINRRSPTEFRPMCSSKVPSKLRWLHIFMVDEKGSQYLNPRPSIYYCTVNRTLSMLRRTVISNWIDWFRLSSCRFSSLFLYSSTSLSVWVLSSRSTTANLITWWGSLCSFGAPRSRLRERERERDQLPFSAKFDASDQGSDVVQQLFLRVPLVYGHYCLQFHHLLLLWHLCRPSIHVNFFSFLLLLLCEYNAK